MIVPAETETTYIIFPSDVRSRTISIITTFHLVSQPCRPSTHHATTCQSPWPNPLQMYLNAFQCVEQHRLNVGPAQVQQERWRDRRTGEMGTQSPNALRTSYWTCPRAHNLGSVGGVSLNSREFRFQPSFNLNSRSSGFYRSSSTISDPHSPIRGPNVKQRVRTRTLIQRCARGVSHAGHHANSPHCAL